MSGPAVVRPVTSQDLDRWLPLWHGYNAFYGRSGETALPDDVTHTTWSRFLDTDQPVHALVAERDGRLIGLAHYLFHRLTISIAFVCYLEDLFTTEEARGTGVGSALIRAVTEHAATVGATHLYWHTHQTNSAARRLYDKLATHSGFLVYRADIHASTT